MTDSSLSERALDLVGNSKAVADALRAGRSVSLIRCAYSDAGRLPCITTGRLPSCKRCSTLRRQEMTERG